MKIVFSKLIPKSKRVHIQTVTFELIENCEYKDETHDLVVSAEFSDSASASYDDMSWGRVDDDICQDYYFSATDGSFLRDGVKFKQYSKEDIVWTDPIYYELSSRSYFDPCFYNDRIRARKVVYHRSNFDLLRDTITPMLIGNDFRKRRDLFNCMAWPTILAFYSKLKSNPSFRIVMGKRKGDVGPWVFSKHKKGLFADEEITPNQQQAYELKRWLHGHKSIHGKPKEIMKQAARRRIIKHRVTASDITFFQTIFGASQVGRWMKEAQNKTKHEHTRN